MNILAVNTHMREKFLEICTGVIAQRSALGGADHAITVTLTMSPNELQCSIFDNDGAAVYITGDDLGFTIERQDPIAQTTTYTKYDRRGLALKTLKINTKTVDVVSETSQNNESPKPVDPNQLDLFTV